MKTFLLECFTGCPVRMGGLPQWLSFVRWPIMALVLMSGPINLQAQFTYTINITNGTITITGYSGAGGAVTIPSTINGRQVTAIASWAFYATRITSVTIPDSVSRISDGAFFDCAYLTNIVVGTGATNIGDWAFAFCTNLTSICFRGSAPVLEGTDVFYSNTAMVYYLPNTVGWGPTLGGRPAILTNIPVPFSYITTNNTITITGYSGTDGSPAIPEIIDFLPVTAIGKNAFVYSSITNITVPNCIRTIGDIAFFGCESLVGVKMGAGVTNIGSEVFEYCGSLTEIEVDPFNASYGSLGGVLFNKLQTTLIKYPEAKVGSYTVPNGVTNIESEGFHLCTNLTAIIISDSVKTIGTAAFSECAALTNMTIGTNITQIPNSAFAFCEGLTAVSIPANVTSIGSGAFASCTKLTDISIGNGVTNIGSDAFWACGGLVNITIPDNVISIGREAFSFCQHLVSITFGTHLVSMGESVFENCQSLANVAIPDTVSDIPGSAFWYCVSLTNVTIGSSVTNIGDSAFHECTSLKTVIIPDSVITIQDGAFRFCTNLTNIALGRRVSFIDTLAFGDCTGLTSLSLPDSVTSIGNEIVYNCTGLTNIIIGRGLTNIADHTFSYCSNLANITIPGSVTSIGGFAFEFCTSLRGVYFQGNAPNVASWAFAYLWDPVVYYLPGTLGWGPTLGVAQAVLWNPQVEINDASFGVQTNQFGFNITGTANIPIVLEACTSLANQQWVPLQSCTLTNGSVYFADPEWTNYPSRSYRIRSP